MSTACTSRHQHWQVSSSVLTTDGSEGTAWLDANGGAARDAAVERQPDGLPRLPGHLEYHKHYDPGTHCPVCSLDEEEEHPTGEQASHAATLVSQPPAAAKPPQRLRDRHGLALLRSLRRPKHLPHWWGARHAAWQSRCAEALESSAVHYAIIALTLLDLSVVVTELILSSIFPIREEAPHAVHTAEEALSWASISILCIFVAELAAKLSVFGHRYFTGSWWHMTDAAVVVASLALELSLKGIAAEVASLLVFFRLWRVLRVMHGVAEAMELNHEGQVERHHALVHALQQAGWAGDLAAQQQRVHQLEQQLAAVSTAAASAGVDVPSLLQQVDFSSTQLSEGPDMLRAAGASAVARKGRTGSSGSSGTARDAYVVMSEQER